MNNTQGSPNSSHNPQYRTSPENSFPLPFWKRVTVRAFSFFEREEANTATSQIGIAIMLAGLLLFAATFVRASTDEILTKRKPEASVGPATKEGTPLVKEEWRQSR
jgi:hypothetical protein